MKIITCASYYGSGSSAVTDLVSEYENVKNLSNFEFRFLHDLDGVRDLEYHLVENHNRHNSGHALKRFAKLSKFNDGNFMSKRYSQFFDAGEYWNITSDYINNLSDFKYTGWWFYDIYDKGSKIYYLYQMLNHIYRKIPGHYFRILKHEKTIGCHPSESLFLKYTQEYVARLMEALNKENYEYLEIDQIVPSANIESVLRYFTDELFVFIVDRDPRDVYLSEKYCWHEYVCPTDPDLFCKWFVYAREAGHGILKETPHIVKLQFEDLIYRYEDSVCKVENITGLKSKSHTTQFSKMNPKRSAINTRMWEKYPNDEGVKIIERKLEKYLYDYSNVDLQDVKGIDVNDCTNF